jgi:hypothetical protein
MQITCDNEGYTHVDSIKCVYPKLYQRIVDLAPQDDILHYNRVEELVFFEDEDATEGVDFWCSVNHIEGLEDAKKMQPHLFEQPSSTFVNCFGVEIHQNTHLRADDVIVDFTKKKRISDF